METFSALLAICPWNSPVTGEFHAQRPVTRSFDGFFDLRLTKRLSKQWWGWWFERHRAHYGVTVMSAFCITGPFMRGLHKSPAPVTGRPPAKGPVVLGFDVSFVVSLKKLNKRSSSRASRCHNVHVTPLSCKNPIISVSCLIHGIQPLQALIWQVIMMVADTLPPKSTKPSITTMQIKTAMSHELYYKVCSREFVRWLTHRYLYHRRIFSQP